MADTAITPLSGSLAATGFSGVGFGAGGFYTGSTGSTGRKAGYRSDATTLEQRIHTGRCRLYGVHPELITTGTITIRDGVTPGENTNTKHVCAIGMLQAGKNFGNGVDFNNGLSVQVSVITDRALLSWEAL